MTKGTRSRAMRGVLQDVLGIEMQHHMPAEPLDAAEHRIEHREVRGAAEMPDEIETHASHAAGLQPVELGIGHAGIEDGDAAPGAAGSGDRVQHRRVVGAVAARLHDHRALDAEEGVQPAQRLGRRIGRGIGAARRIGVAVGRAEDVAMRVAGAGRRLEARSARRGVRGLATPLAHARSLPAAAFADPCQAMIGAAARSVKCRRYGTGTLGSRGEAAWPRPGRAPGRPNSQPWP